MKKWWLLAAFIGFLDPWLTPLLIEETPNSPIFMNAVSQLSIRFGIFFILILAIGKIGDLKPRKILEDTYEHPKIEERSRKDEVLKLQSVTNQKFNHSDNVLRGRITDGIISYGRFYPSESEILWKAQQLSKEKAWQLFRESFWKTRYKSIQRFFPEIYNEIIYWQNHLHEYIFYINFKWALGIPFKEYDLWV